MSDPSSGNKSERRRRGFILMGALFLAAGVAWGLYWLLVARFYETTDDAYVAGNIVAVTSRENATVTALYADNTQAVKRGQLLIEMDPSVAEVAMRAAEAQLARAISPAPIPFPRNWRRRRWRWRRRKAITSAGNRRWAALCRARNCRMPAMPLRLPRAR